MLSPPVANGEYVMTCRPLIIALGLLAIGRAQTIALGVTLSTPIAAEVYVKGDGKATALRGRLTSYDDTQFTLHLTGTEQRTLNWTDITPASGYALRLKTIDRTQSSSWMDLGRFAWGMGLKDQAKMAFKSAVRLDGSSQQDADTIMQSPAGGMLATATTRPAGGELMNAGGTASANTKSAPDAALQGSGNPNAPVIYKAATPEQADAAMKAYHEQAGEVEKKLKLHFDSFETDHFLVFTDWDSREAGFLKENLENAYRVVSQQFNLSPKDNIFIGKLPVYMLNTYGEFAEFATRIDKFPTTGRTAGYYFGNSLGVGHMAMWKPNETLTGTSNIQDAKRLWAYVLVHEFTHAFLARYRSNEFVPRWLNEGIAEVIASGEFPYPEHAQIAHLMAVENKDVSFLFDSANMPTGEYYPVMQSMTELLIRDNRANFLKLIDAIKDGQDPETALKKLYNTDYPQLARVWRDWARRH